MKIPTDPIGLHQALTNHFDEQELQTLCFSLQVDYQSLPAIGKANKARELLLLLAREERLDELLNNLVKMRPNVAWPEAAAIPELTQAMQPELMVPPPAKTEISIGGSMQGQISGGDMTINAPVAGGDLTINPEAPRWQRWVLLALLPLLILIVIGLSALIRPMFTPKAEGPDIDRMLPVLATFSPALTVTAMARSPKNNDDTLWFGAWQDEQSKLFRLDMSAQEKAVPQAVLDVDEQISEIMVDCRGNIWFVLNNLGVQVYQPSTGRHDFFLSKQSAPNLMEYNTMSALAHRCKESGEIDVWLGREGIRTARYQSDYPTLDTLTVIPANIDPVHIASQGNNVTDLMYVPATSKLWSTNQNGELLSISTNEVSQPQITPTEEDTLWSLDIARDGTVWAGGNHHLVENGRLLPISDEDGHIPDSRARLLAIGSRWVWFGDNCTDLATDCWVLGAYQYNQFFPVDLNTRHTVSGITIDNNNIVWIGTENGLFLYP